MSSQSSPNFSSEAENSLQEKLIRSIWLQSQKYPYVFEPDGSCKILRHERRGRYTISAEGRSAVLTWTNPAYTEDLCVLEDGSLFLGGGILVEVDRQTRHSSFPCYPLPQPDTHSYRFEFDSWKWPDYGTITLEGLQVRLIRTDSRGNFISEDLREFQSLEEAEDYYHLTILSNDPCYFPGSVRDAIYLELSDDSSHEFYEVTVNGLVVISRYGQIGTPGQTSSSTYGSPRKAQAAAVNDINEKLKQGYVRASMPVPEPPQPKLESVQSVRPAWKSMLPSPLLVIQILLPVMVLLSPTLFMLWGAFARVGLTWSLLLIPVGAMVGFVLMAIAGMYWCEYIFWLDDRQTGPPEAGSLGAATGRAIVSFIAMALLGWIGSGLGAWWVASYWVDS